MNACAIQFLKGYGTKTELPQHEPVMAKTNERWATEQSETRLLAVDPRSTYDAVYLCKHCGLLYMEEE